VEDEVMTKGDQEGWEITLAEAVAGLDLVESLDQTTLCIGWDAARMSVLRRIAEMQASEQHAKTAAFWALEALAAYVEEMTFQKVA
jgi:hypothetical protein